MRHGDRGVLALTLRRRRKFHLWRAGVLLEIAHHYGKKTMCAEFTLSSGKWNIVYGDTIETLFKSIRLELSELMNPEIKIVRLRIQGRKV